MKSFGVDNISFVGQYDNITTPYSNTTVSAEWRASLILSTIITSSILLLNISALPLFLKAKWNNFYAYLINLLLANIMFNALASPLEIINSLYPVWWLEESMCSFYLYASWVLAYVSPYAHILITANRLWAVTFPISYRRNATTKTAVILCLGSWVLAHIFTLPGILMDRIYHKLPIDEHGCVVNVTTALLQRSWLLFLQLQVFLCEVLIIAAYPYIWYRLKNSRRVSTLRINGVSDAHERPLAATSPARLLHCGRQTKICK